MDQDLLKLYGQASAWTADKVGGAKDLDATTPCDEWSVRDLLNHMLDTQRYFLGALGWTIRAVLAVQRSRHGGGCGDRHNARQSGRPTAR